MSTLAGTTTASPIESTSLAPTATNSRAPTTLRPAASTTLPSQPSPVTATTTSPPVAPPTTIPPPTEKVVLVTGQDGLYLVDSANVATQIVDGNVAYAVDDARGGLLYQLDRGRTWDDEPGWSTTVWWVPAGSDAPRELLVPERGSGHRISLHDAYATGGGFAIVYTRHEGSIPDVDMSDRLRTYDVQTRTATDLLSVGGFESGIGMISVNAGIVALTSFGQVGGVCEFLDTAGNPRWIPGYVPEPQCDFGCPSACVISDDGRQMAFHEVHEPPIAEVEITVIATADGATTDRLAVPQPQAQWSPRSLDISGSRLLLNRREGSGYGRAWVFDLDAPDEPKRELPVAGSATFAEGPIDIPSPVRLTTGPDYYRYGEDGLFRVVSGVATGLATARVVWVADDLDGGALFRYHRQPEDDTTYRVGADDSIRALSGPVDTPRFVAPIDGQPTYAEFVTTPDGDKRVDLLLWNASSGSTTLLPNIGWIDDGWSYPTSYGEGWFVGVDGEAIGCGGSDGRFTFWDRSGRRMQHPHNPAPEPSGPRELSIAVSPNGRYIASTIRNDAPSDIDGRLKCGERDKWWADTQRILGELTVTDLSTGHVTFRMTTLPQTRISDFDGRYVVVAEPPGWYDDPAATIYDTQGQHDPVVVVGNAALLR